MKQIEITMNTDDPLNILLMFKLKAVFAEVRLSEPLPDTLTVQFSCAEESKAPVMQYRINDGEEIQSMKIKDLNFSFPTTFFPTPKSVACMIGNEVVMIGGQATQKARRIVVARFGKQGLSVPPEIYTKALSEAITFNPPKGSIEIRGDKKTRDVADALGIDQQIVRYHLRNLLSEGVDIGKENRWETAKEFERICNLIKPRLGAHGRRA